MGNHDYDVPEVPRAFSEDLFKRMFDIEPYYAVEYAGFQFLMTNSQKGPTWDDDPMNQFLNTGQGSFGREQLAWIAEKLDSGKPTFLMFHHPLYVVEENEDPEGPYAGMPALIDAYKDTLEAIYVGHSHTWLGGYDDELGLMNVVLGSTRYDADNWWLHSFDAQTGDWEILDEDKANWLSGYAYPTTYDPDVIVDTRAEPEGDAADPWDGVALPGDGGPDPSCLE